MLSQSDLAVLVQRTRLFEQGEIWLTTTGRSMMPTIATGDKIRVTRSPKIAPGEIVLFENNFLGLVCHRVVAVEGNKVVSRGDHSPDCEWHEKNMVMGVVKGIHVTPRGVVERIRWATGKLLRAIYQKKSQHSRLTLFFAQLEI